MPTEHADRLLGVTPLGKGNIRSLHGLLGVGLDVHYFDRTHLLSHPHFIQGVLEIQDLSRVQSNNLRGSNERGNAGDRSMR